MNLELKDNGIKYLQENLKILDPKHYNNIDLSNSQRLIRALEVCRITSKPYSSLLTSKQKIRSFKIVKFLLHIDKNQLEINIDGNDHKLRVDLSYSSANHVKLSSQPFLDQSDWAMVTCILDTTNGTASERIRLYWNSVRLTLAG